MEAALGHLITAGPPALLAGFVAAIVFYVRCRNASGPEHQPAAAPYFFGTAIAGVLAYVTGAGIGIWAACSSADAGNLCGLTGIFGLGPLLSGAAMFAFGFLWSGNVRPEQ